MKECLFELGTSPTPGKVGIGNLLVLLVPRGAVWDLLIHLRSSVRSYVRPFVRPFGGDLEIRS